jgi:hypothetical protein
MKSKDIENNSGVVAFKGISKSKPDEIKVSDLSGDNYSNPQLDLFRTFFCSPSEKEDFSNTVDIWDSAPRYSISAQEMSKRRNELGGLPLLNLKFNHRGKQYSLKIQPAKIEENGRTIEYYPSASEELIEDALRKIALRQNSGFFDERKFQSGAVFSLYELREELACRGHARSYQQVIKSLTILQRSHIEIRVGEGNGSSFAASNYFSAVVSVSREDLKEDPESKWVVQFYPLVTVGINGSINYRQFNYAVMMSLSSQLARWLHKLLCSKFVFASISGNPFELHYSTIKRDSNMLNHGREIDNRRRVDESIKKLIDASVLMKVVLQPELGANNKIIDVTYFLYPTMDFIKEIKAANKKGSINLIKD